MAGWHYSGTMKGGEINGLGFSLKPSHPYILHGHELDSCSLIDERKSLVPC